MATNEWDSDREYHESLVSSSSRAADRQNNAHQQEIETTPLFSADVLKSVLDLEKGGKDKQRSINGTQTNTSLTPVKLYQYSFLAKVLKIFGGHDQQNTDDIQPIDSDKSSVAISQNGQPFATKTGDSRLFVNISAPWSAFICGSQGSGKSHTLSCMLEAALKPSRLGKLPSPLAGMVFHYDKFTGISASQICEAAYLISTDTPVRILVSPSNFYRMKRVYENMSKLPRNAPKPIVAPLLLEEKHLNIERMMKLMAVDEKEGKISLYMEVSEGIGPCQLGGKLTIGQSVCRILRSMAMRNQYTAGLNYQDFKDKLALEKFNEGQRAMLSTRLQLLESFMYPRQGIKWINEDDARERAKIAKAGIWSFQSGSLTIVDLSCPFVDESAACALFNICLAIFLEDRGKIGRIVALDEAHKVRNSSMRQARCVALIAFSS